MDKRAGKSSPIFVKRPFVFDFGNSFLIIAGSDSRRRKSYARQRINTDTTGNDEEHVGILEFSTEQATEDVDIEEYDVTETRKNSAASVSGGKCGSMNRQNMGNCNIENA